MSASAKPKQVIECLSLLRSCAKILILQDNKACRQSVILMLQAKIQSTSISNILDADGVVHCLESIIASESVDQELNQCLRTFLQRCLFPPEEYKKVFFPDEWIAENHFGEPKQNKTEKGKIKVGKIWSFTECFRDPAKCAVILEVMHEAYKIQVRRQRQSVPFMDIVEVSGLSHDSFLAHPNEGHCHLLVVFMDILKSSNLIRIGNNNTRSAHIITKVITSMTGSDEISSIEIENILKATILLDPGILIMSMGTLWRRWIQDQSLDTMISLAKYYGKRNEPALIFKDLFAQSNIIMKLRKSNYLNILNIPMKALAENVLPPAKIELIEYITDSLIIHSQDMRLVENPNNPSVFTMVNILYVSLHVILDSMIFEELNLARDDENKFSNQLNVIMDILEKYFQTSEEWYLLFFSWWKLEKKRRLFLTPTKQLFSEKLISKISKYPSTVPQVNFKIQIEKVHWAVMCDFDLETIAEALCKYLHNSLETTVDIDGLSEDILEEIAEDLYNLQPNLFLCVIDKMWKSTNASQKKLAICVMEDNEDIFFGVISLTGYVVSNVDLALPVTFLSDENLLKLIEKIDVLNPASLNLLNELLYSSMKKLLVAKFGKNFYKMLKRQDTDSILYKVSNETIRNIYGKKGFKKLKEELTDYKNLPFHILVAWTTTLYHELDKNQECRNFAWKISTEILQQRLKEANFDIVLSKVVRIMHYVMTQDADRNLSNDEAVMLRSLVDQCLTLVEILDVKESVACIQKSLILLGDEGKTMAFNLLQKVSISSLPVITEIVWPIFDKKQAFMRLRMLNHNSQKEYDFTNEVNHCIKLVSNFVCTDEDMKAERKKFLEEIFSLLLKAPNDGIQTKLKISNKLMLDQNLKLPNKYLRIILGFSSNQKLTSATVSTQYELLNNIVKRFEQNLVDLIPAFLTVLRNLLLHIFTETSKDESLRQLSLFKRLMSFIRTKACVKSVISGVGNLLPYLLRIQVKLPDGGISESILLNIISELNERQLLSYMSVLTRDEKKVFSSVLITFKEVKKRKLQTV